jgi:aryl-alcohol dehydrogenase-like predicted oxidoreductase
MPNRAALASEVERRSHATMRSFEDSLQRLGLNRVDILLIHDADERSQGDRYAETLRTVEHVALRALERLKAEGVIEAFGAGVNQAEACARSGRQITLLVPIESGRSRRRTRTTRRALDPAYPRYLELYPALRPVLRGAAIA